MITLFHHAEGPVQNRVKVLLDVTPVAVDEMDDSLNTILNEAQDSGRAVGGVFRYFGGNSYFTYDPAQRPQLEVSLLAALATPKAEMYVTQDSGSNDKW